MKSVTKLRIEKFERNCIRQFYFRILKEMIIEGRDSLAGYDLKPIVIFDSYLSIQTPFILFEYAYLPKAFRMCFISRNKIVFCIRKEGGNIWVFNSILLMYYMS